MSSLTDAHADHRVVLQGFKVLGIGIRTRPVPFAVAVAGGLLYGGMTVVAALVLGEVTDRVILPAFAAGEVAAGSLAAAAAAIVGVAVAKALGIVGRRVGGSWMQLGLHAEFRRRVTRRYLALPLAWHRRHATGTLLSNANADVEAVWSPIAPLPMSVGVAFMLLVTGVVLLLSDPWLALVGFLMGPLLGLLNWRFNRLYRIPARIAQERRARVAAIAHESFDGGLVVKTLGLEARETDRFRAETVALRDELVRLARVRAVFEPLLDALPQAAVLLVVIVGTLRVVSGAVSEGDVVQFAYLFSQVALPIRIIGYLLSELPRSVVGWERVRRVLEASGDAAHGTATAEGRGPAEVATKALSYRYPDAPDEGDAARRAALDRMTLEVPTGRVLAVVGPTGAGKSTLAGLLVRLVDPDDGAVLLDGVDLRELREGAVAGAAALVFQETFLFDDTVRENITLGLDVPDEQVWWALRLAHADGFVEALPDGLDTRLGERGATLSGGQRQRIALARALVRRPRLLLLDDATSSVDVAVEADILASLRDADLGATVLVVASRRATIALADEVVFVDLGRVVARGTHEELLASEPGYAALLTAYEAERAA